MMDPIRATPLQGDREVAYRNIFFALMSLHMAQDFYFFAGKILFI